jgi:DnaJ family protein C protein 13
MSRLAHLSRVRKKTITVEQFTENRLGSFSNDLAITPLAEFAVTKLSPRHSVCVPCAACMHVRTLRAQEPVARLMGLSESCIIERDPGTYSVVTLRALCDVRMCGAPCTLALPSAGLCSGAQLG